MVIELSGVQFRLNKITRHDVQLPLNYKKAFASRFVFETQMIW